MCTTHTQDTMATTEQINSLHKFGAAIVRIAVDSKRDATALEQIRDECSA